MANIEDREPTAKEIVFALKCAGQCSCDEDCYYYGNRAALRCQNEVKRDAVNLIEKGISK